MQSTTKLLLTAIAAAALFPVAATAQADFPNQGYLVDGSNSIVKSGLSGCWHTRDWSPARAVMECDPSLMQVAAVTPAPPAAQPVPTPPPATAVIIVPIPVTPTTKKVSFSGDALFAFDKSELKPEGVAMLDTLVGELKGARYDAIVVTGHTDRIGSSQYNQKLSERRANTVKDYLVAQSVTASRIEAQGKGETQPETKAGECQGAKSAKVIACLQPDRRVDVEVTGSKTTTSGAM
jgi:OOP family OmpA-OmpF porin